MSYNNIIEIRNFRPINTLHCKHLLYILRFFQNFFIFSPSPPEKSCLKPLSDLPQPFCSSYLAHSPALSPWPSSPSKKFILLCGNSRREDLFFPSADVSCPYLRKVTHAFAEDHQRVCGRSIFVRGTFRSHIAPQLPVAHFGRGRSPLFLHKVEF